MFSLNDRQIIVNYHYVENPRPEFSGIAPCSVGDFERQVRLLSANYRIVSVPEVVGAAGSAERLAAVTFDDGLTGQLTNAVPILNKHKAAATFFVITSVWDGHLPSAHKIHQLLSRLPAEKLIDLFRDFVAEFYPERGQQYHIPKDRRLTNRRLHEDASSANFKEMLTMIPEDIKGRFLRYGFKKFGLDEEAITKNIFMSKRDVAGLWKMGMTIGNHSHSHYAFDVINEETAKAELALAQKILAETIGERPRIFSYPHGRSSAAAVAALEAAGLDYALTIERRPVGPQDSHFLIPRYDTADLPRG